MLFPKEPARSFAVKNTKELAAKASSADGRDIGTKVYYRMPPQASYRNLLANAERRQKEMSNVALNQILVTIKGGNWPRIIMI